MALALKRSLDTQSTLSIVGQRIFNLLPHNEGNDKKRSRKLITKTKKETLNTSQHKLVARFFINTKISFVNVGSAGSLETLSLKYLILNVECLDNYQNLRSRLEIFISTVPKDLDLKSSVDPVYSSLLF
ncbi:hypothetical protein GQX74_010438 [Glossina fuscipes]|nr:hypothetical protein GQX74_010438 [Glossina fuscipes]